MVQSLPANSGVTSPEGNPGRQMPSGFLLAGTTSGDPLDRKISDRVRDLFRKLKKICLYKDQVAAMISVRKEGAGGNSASRTIFRSDSGS